MSYYLYTFHLYDRKFLKYLFNVFILVEYIIYKNTKRFKKLKDLKNSCFEHK